MFRSMLILTSLVVVAVTVGCDPTSPPNKAGDASTRDRTPETKDEKDNANKDQVSSKDAGKSAKTDSNGLPISEDAPWIKPEDRQKLFMDFNMTDQNGKPFNLKEALGKPTVATFIFTRCPNPQMCPLQARKMAWIQEKLDKAKLGEHVNLLLISFDPDYDTPERLKKFGQDNGVKFTNARMLRPSVPEFREFIDEFPIRVGYSNAGEVNHKTDLFMLDHQGGFARMYYGMWDDDKVLKEVQQLVNEANDAKVVKPDAVN